MKGLHEEGSTVSFRKRLVTLVLVLMTALILVPGTAFAHRLYQGDDYSQTIRDRHRVAICDYERDGNESYTKFHTYSGLFSRKQDQDGAGGYCGYSNYYPSRIYDHNVCENRKFRPNPCTNYYR